MLSSPTGRRVLPYLLLVLFGLGLGWINTHTDETPFVAIPLFASAFGFGLAWPRGAWRWALGLAVWVPLSQAAALLAGVTLPYENNWGYWPVVSAAIAIAVALLGAYLGVGARWLIRSSTGAADHLH